MSLQGDQLHPSPQTKLIAVSLQLNQDERSLQVEGILHCDLDLDSSFVSPDMVCW